MPMLSVISGAYNLENCFSFEKSIESVLHQTFTDFEFIICDDGSTDKTYEMLKEFAGRDSRIKLLKNEKNLGHAAALNKCIEAASGMFIARHDCDDYNDETRFQKQIEYMTEHPDVDVLGTAAFLYDRDGVWDSVYFPKTVENKSFLFTSPYQHGSVVFKREALMRAGGYRVAKETRRNEDYDLFMRMQVFAKGENLQERLYYFLEDEAALKRRKYRFRIDEAKIRFKGFSSLGLMPKGFFHAIKPLVVGLIPGCILKKLRAKRRKKINGAIHGDSSQKGGAE